MFNQLFFSNLEVFYKALKKSGSTTRLTKKNLPKEALQLFGEQ